MITTFMICYTCDCFGIRCVRVGGIYQNVGVGLGCSMRDLSLLLEGLLQTNKGAVLKDIMNKNGEHHFQSQPLYGTLCISMGT